MAILLLTSDLATSSRVAGAAARQSLTVTTAMSVARLDELPDSPHELAILDLGLPGLDVRDAVLKLRARPTPPRRIVAFGPHVHEALLAAAQDAGCDRVMARGQFYSRLDEIMAAVHAAE